MRDLKTLQDWVLERRFRAVPGVIDVTAWGGKTKTYEVQVDPRRLTAYGLTLAQLLQTLNNSNINVGGNTLDIGPQVAVVRGVGLIRSIDDIKNTMLTQSGGTPVLIRDVANVVVGNKPRLGIAGRDGQNDIVQGIVLMRRGEKSMPAIKRVEAEIERINSSNILPPGVHIERIYDRKDLIDITTSTVLHNMVFGIALIFILQWCFLGNLRTALIVGATIPFALFFAVGIIVLRGESANLLSVGAIDFGLIVDATVIMVESIFRRLSTSWEESVPKRLRSDKDDRLTGKVAAIYQAGHICQPVDLLCRGYYHRGVHTAFHIRRRGRAYLRPDGKNLRLRTRWRPFGNLYGDARAERASSSRAYARDRNLFSSGYFTGLYTPALRAAVVNKKLTVTCAAILMVGSLLAVKMLGLEFLPKLEEGNLWIRATMPSTISLGEGNGYVNRIRATLRSFSGS